MKFLSKGNNTFQNLNNVAFTELSTRSEISKYAKEKENRTQIKGKKAIKAKKTKKNLSWDGPDIGYTKDFKMIMIKYYQGNEGKYVQSIDGNMTLMNEDIGNINKEKELENEKSDKNY